MYSRSKYENTKDVQYNVKTDNVLHLWHEFWRWYGTSSDFTV